MIRNKLGGQSTIYSVVRSTSDTVVNESKFNDASITLPEEIADAFNTYFTDIGPNVAGSIDDTNVTFDRLVKPATSKMTRFKLVSHTKVIKLLNVYKVI